MSFYRTDEATQYCIGALFESGTARFSFTDAIADCWMTTSNIRLVPTNLRSFEIMIERPLSTSQSPWLFDFCISDLRVVLE